MNTRLLLIFSSVFLLLSGCNDPPIINPGMYQSTVVMPGNCKYVSEGYGPSGTEPIHAVKLVTGLEIPWGLAFLPGNNSADLLITERPGRLRLIRNGQLMPNPVITVQVGEDGEGGLLGITLHPNFPSNNFFYMFYTTVNSDGKSVNRVQRYVLSSDHQSATPDKIIVDNIPAGVFHDGGNIKFGPDGNLYISTGDAYVQNSAQDTSSLNGKILRYTPDGGIPGDNPDSGNPWFISGLRNAEGFDWITPSTMVIADNGPTGEYLNRFGGDKINVANKGDDLGWPKIWHCETGPGLNTSVLSWKDDVPPGGATFYTGSQIPNWTGNFFVATLKSQNLQRVVFTQSSPVAVQTQEVYLQDQFGRLRNVVDGPDGYLYLTTSNCDTRGTCPDDGDYLLMIRPGAQ